MLGISPNKPRRMCILALRRGFFTVPMNWGGVIQPSVLGENKGVDTGCGFGIIEVF